MALKGFTRNFKPLEILTEEQVDAIHRGALDVLQVTGVRIEHERALKLFEKNGCKVDYDEMRVRIPPGLVEECLRKAPSSFRLKVREPKNDVVFGGNTLYFMSSVGLQTVDLDSWEARVATRKEIYDAVTVLDALDNCHYLAPYSPYTGFEGVPPVMSMPEGFAARLRNSTKATMSGYSMDCEMFHIAMAKAVGTELTGMCLASPPLTYFADAIESAFRFVEAGFPLYMSTGEVYGGSGPATIAGSVITSTATLMAAIVLAQLIKPGTRVLPADFTFPMNMQTGAPAFGSIGVSLHQAVFHQVWRKYEIPAWNGGSGPAFSDSKRIDFQSGYERAIPTLIIALSGAHCLVLHGGVYGELTYHPVQSILDDDIAGMVGRFIEGVQVNNDTLAIDLIEEVGPIPGHFLNKEHTRKWWKHEQFMPKVADRLAYPDWARTGKKSALDYAKERMEEILATHKPTPLTPSQEEEVERILKEAREYYKKKGLISDAEWEVYMKTLESPNYPYG